MSRRQAVAQVPRVRLIKRERQNDHVEATGTAVSFLVATLVLFLLRM